MASDLVAFEAMSANSSRSSSLLPQHQTVSALLKISWPSVL